MTLLTSIQETLAQYSKTVGVHVYMLDTHGQKIQSCGNPPLFLQFAEKTPAYRAWQREMLSETEDYAVVKDPTGLANSVLAIRESGRFVCCILVGPFRCTTALPVADEEIRAFAHALPVVSQDVVAQYASLLKTFMDGVLPVVLRAQEAEERVEALQAAEEYLNDVLFVLDLNLLIERSLDFFVHKLKIGNCTVRTSEGVFRYHANPPLLSIYDRAELLIEKALHNMSGFISSKNIMQDPVLGNVSGIDKLPHQLLAANIPGGIMVLYSDKGLVDHTPLAYALMQKFSRALEKSKMYMQAHKQSMTDALTGIHNRAYFSQRLREAIEQEKEQGKEEGTQLSVCMLDVDNFKKYNDTNGHLAGDKALQNITTAITRVLGKTDVFARYGGEEFVLLLFNKSAEEALQNAEAVRASVAQNTELTVSIGLVTAQTSQQPEILLEQADNALYEAKRSGKNKVVCATLE